MLKKNLGLYLLFQFSACNCNIEGVKFDGVYRSRKTNELVAVCDNNNGLCDCKANITNRQCDACIAGHVNFPTCEAAK